MLVVVYCYLLLSIVIYCFLLFSIFTRRINTILQCILLLFIVVGCCLLLSIVIYCFLLPVIVFHFHKKDNYYSTVYSNVIYSCILLFIVVYCCPLLSLVFYCFPVCRLAFQRLEVLCDLLHVPKDLVGLLIPSYQHTLVLGLSLTSIFFRFDH